MATITHPTGNGYCRDRILRDRPSYVSWVDIAIIDAMESCDSNRSMCVFYCG